jgi:hypothetical protein
MSFYNEDYWMTDSPHKREFALTYCQDCSQRYMIRQWDPKFGWFPAPEGKLWWRPLDPPPIKTDNVSSWIAIKTKEI